MSNFDPSRLTAQDEGQQPDPAAVPAEDAGDAGDAAYCAEPSKPRNSTAILLFVLALIGAGMIYFMKVKITPKAAAATPQATTAKATIGQFLTDGGKSLVAMRELLRNTEKIVEQFMLYPTMTQVKVDDLKTNPFRFDTGKAPDDTADHAKAAQKLKDEQAAVLDAVKKLQLQSVLVSGTARTCMVNNKAATEGNEVDGFIIEKINPDGVVVKKYAPLNKKWFRFEVKIVR